MEPESSASAAPPEQALTEALLALSWPLPRTVVDADAALSRLEAVKAVLTALEQQSVGTEAWWAGQVDALATQSGFVLEWWRPVLRDPDLDWTLNHQAHLTADLATLASAGARLLDQIEPRAAEEAAEAAHARRVAQDKRWGPAAVPPFAPTGPRPGAPGSRPQPPSAVFGDAVPLPVQSGTGPGQGPRPAEDLNAPQFPPMPPATAPVTAAGPAAVGAAGVAAAAAFDPDAPPVAAPPSIPAQAHPQQQPQPHAPAQPHTSAAPAHPHAQASGGPAHPHASAAVPAATGTGFPPAAGPGPAQIPASAAFPASPASATESSSASARHRRPAYDFDDPRGSAPPPAVYPQAGMPPRSPVVPGPGFGGPPQGRRLAPAGGYPPPDYGSGPFGFAGEDDDEPDSLVPAGLRRHQRRLLMQTGAILGAIGVLCWWAVYTLASPSPHASAASGETTHAAPGSTDRTVAGGLTTPEASAPAASKPTDSATSPATAPSTAMSSVPDATTVSSVRVTLLGGSATVPQIVALITVDTGGTGQVTVTGSYYGASGASEVQAETERWTLSGKTAYQYSVPIANSGYCGTTFHFTLSAGGHSDAEQTQPGC